MPLRNGKAQARVSDCGYALELGHVMNEGNSEKFKVKIKDLVKKWPIT
jgi:hypothetical protein